jgi:hypothetical protein
VGEQLRSNGVGEAGSRVRGEEKQEEEKRRKEQDETDRRTDREEGGLQLSEG